MKTLKELPIIGFSDKKHWQEWLKKEHLNSTGIWMQIAKKNSEFTSVSYDEAIEVALCYGWIDGQKKSFDENSWLQKFTPRSAKSVWSAINKKKAEHLIETKQMRSAGLKAIENAKANGQWDKAYESQKKMEVPEDFEKELKKNKPAWDNFKLLDSANRYAFLYRLHHTSRPEKRVKKIEDLIKKLARGKFH